MSFNPLVYKYSDYVKWEGDRELIEGYPFIVTPNPLGRHQYLSMKLARIFDEMLEEYECEPYPELDWIIDENTVVRPDIVVYCEEIETCPKTTPKIVIEVISESTAEKDEKSNLNYRREKVKIYRLDKKEYDKVYE